MTRRPVTKECFFKKRHSGDLKEDNVFKLFFSGLGFCVGVLKLNGRCKLVLPTLSNPKRVARAAEGIFFPRQCGRKIQGNRSWVF